MGFSTLDTLNGPLFTFEVHDIQTGPNGNMFVVSLSDGAIYEIFRRR